MSAGRAHARRALGRSFASLSDRTFRRWFASQIVSASGNTTQSVGLAWLVLGATGRAIDLSLLAGCTFGPSLLLGPWGGTIAQRWPRRRVLITTQLALLLLSVLLFVLNARHTASFRVLLTVALASGTVAALDAPARQLFVRDLVGGVGVASAVSLYEVVLNGARVFGPAFGRRAARRVRPGRLFSCECRVVCTAPGRSRTQGRPHAPCSASARCPRASTDSRWRAHAISRSELRACLCLAVVLGMVFNAGTVLPITAKDVLHRGGASYGSLLTAFGVGAIPGALMAGRATEPLGPTLRRLVAACACAVLITAQSPSVSDDAPW